MATKHDEIDPHDPDRKDHSRLKWWGNMTPVLQAYHDHEWGVPKHDDDQLFELLGLEIFQAGLNWQLVLTKRAALDKAFHGFTIKNVAAMDEIDIDEMMQDPQLIRNRKKLMAMITNARATLQVQKDEGSLDHYLWSFVDFKPLVNKPETPDDIPVSTTLSKQISLDMKKRGYTFVGPVIVYNYLQGAGLIDDHLASWHQTHTTK